MLGLRMLDDIDPLPEVVDDQGREGEIPGADDGPPAQMPHVGLERLSTGGAEDDLGENEKTDQSMVEHELQSIIGTDGLEN